MCPQHLILHKTNLCPLLCPCICILRLYVHVYYANMNITQIQAISLHHIYLSTFLFPSIYFNISHVYDLQVSQLKLCVQFFCLCYMSYTSDTPWFYNPNNILWRVKIMKPLIMQFFPVLYDSLSGWNISIFTLFSDHFDSCFSCRVSCCVTTIQIRGKIIL